MKTTYNWMKNSVRPRKYGKLPGDRPVIQTSIIDGALVFGKVLIREEWVDCADTAVSKLLAGETVMIQEWGALVTQVQLALREKGITC